MPIVWASMSGQSCCQRRWQIKTDSADPSSMSAERELARVSQAEVSDETVVVAAKEHVVRLPVYWVQSVYFTNLFVYIVEWNLYALYFRQVHGWSGTWMGAAQMSGDLFAGIILVLTTTQSCRTGMALWSKRHNTLASLCGAPYCVVVFLLMHGSLFVLLAQPDFAVSLCGQVGMGTTYILNEQALQEMLVQYCTGNQVLYRKNLFVQYLIFCSCFVLAALISVPLYNSFGSTVPFYSCALLAGLHAFAFGGYYVHRLASTRSGLVGGLAAAEQELCSKHEGSAPPITSSSNVPQVFGI